jgi:hypothetical protein
MSVTQSFYVDPGLEAARSKKPQADAREAPSWLDVADANIELQQDRSGYNRAIAFGDAYNKLENALDDDARQRIEAQWSRLGMRDPVTGATSAKSPEARQKLVWAEVERARQAGKGFAGVAASKEEYDGTVYRGLTGNRARNKDVAAREDGWTAGVAGGMAGSLSDPVNAASMFVGGPATGLGRQILIGALVNMGTEVATIPGANRELAFLGDSETAGEQLTNVLLAGGLGVAFPVAIKVGGKTIDLSVTAANKMIPIDKRLAKALGKENLEQVSDRDILEIFSQAVPSEYRTPAQADALALIERQARVTETNPYRNTYADIDVHLKRADEALSRVSSSIVTGRVPAAPAAPASTGANFGRVKALIRGPESGGNDAAVNALGSSASGRYQFVEGTFKNLYKRVYGDGADAAWNSKRRFDGAVQERLMDRLLADNAAVLQRQGVPVSDGNLYVMHVLGSGDGPALLRADPNADVAAVIRANNPKLGNAIVKQNPTYFGGGKTVGQALSIIRSKVGGGSQEISPASGLAALPDGDEIAFARPAALDAVRPVVTAEGRSVGLQAFKPTDIEVDANLMQFKSGGDRQGVTERLRGVQQWDPIAAGEVTVWESVDGRRLIADGHQRLGLATRMLADDPAQNIKLNAFVLREADGISARDARIITALKNIGEGSGTLTDAAKVFREGGDMAAEALAKRLPPRSVLVRDGKSLASLSDEAFGAVVNEVVPDSWGAAIGALAPDPETHMAMIELLAKLNPPNRKQAEGIIRQAMAAGFARETQEELFGSREFSVALFAQKARAVERTLSELKKLKSVFSTAARNADTLEGAGNRIDQAASAAEAADSADALAIVEKMAYVTGDVSEIFNVAAKRLADGEPPARVIADTVAEIRKLELADILNSDRAAGGSGDGAFGSGRGGLFDNEDEPSFGDPFGPDDVNRDPGGLTPEERATLEYEEPGLGLFDDPVGEGPVSQADGLRHDLKAATIEAAEPPLAADMVRVYHSGNPYDGEGGRWVSTDRQYASDYRSNLPLNYVDLPKTDPRLNNPDYAEQGIEAGFTFNFELSPAEAANLKVVAREAVDPMAWVAFAARDGADETAEQVLKSVEAEEAALKALRDCL